MLTVIGARHKKWDERPLLLVVKAEKIEKDTIFEFLENKKAKWWMPDDIVLLKVTPYSNWKN